MAYIVLCVTTAIRRISSTDKCRTTTRSKGEDLKITAVVLFVVGCLASAMQAAAAATFNFSYAFYGVPAPHVVTGSIAGNLNDNGTPGDASDDFVYDPTIVGAFFDGTPMIGPLVMVAYDNTGFIGGATSMHVAGNLNNFLISQCSTSACLTAGYADPAITIDYFLMRAIGQGSPSVAVSYYKEGAPATVVYDSDSTSGRWGTWAFPAADVPSAVPEPASLALIAFGLAGLAASRRRLRV